MSKERGPNEDSGAGLGQLEMVLKQARTEFPFLVSVAPTLDQMDRNWSGISDVIVEASSQRWDALATKPVEIKTKKATQPVGSPHEHSFHQRGGDAVAGLVRCRSRRHSEGGSQRHLHPSG